ncbi:cryptochrome/photolyase family protein [Sphingomonas morindae]|uniref:DNA photolyase family protein n=1 Tax=Sphingomonas morindae TaxID=1541170 RepID=A0ABY4X5Q1_9SPHN|nr:deoxyribodipyrimidine photo-lyase [Sphingomonas morindae]USI72165.1 DNA photolyase family protein [Sphingomonas morindae]
MAEPQIVWLRQDLRLEDQAALAAAAEAGPVVPVYVLDDDAPGAWAMGGASRWWLHHSLAALDAALHARGARLILRRGACVDVLAGLAEELGTRAIHAIRHYEPWWQAAEQALAERLDLCLHDGNQLAPPATITTGAGKPFRIYTPFWRALQQHMPPPAPLPAPRTLAAPARWPKSDRLAAWALLPTKPNWAKGFDWTPGEAAAHEALEAFVEAAGDYGEHRNLPAEQGTSRLSPHLHFGEISPARVWHQVAKAQRDAGTFLGELGWRDFTQGIIRQFPDYADKNGRPAFDALPWRKAPAELRAWQQGRTGYPIVDAGMRQLWTLGWMHNRVRMITASFLVKHLLIDWRAGERWFWDCLVDADYGNNSVNWQWIAGSGVDANMFSRIMAPLGQSEKFAAGDYIRRWVPELKDLPDAAIHDPDAQGCRPADYPAKIVDHREARARALAAYRRVKA